MSASVDAGPIPFLATGRAASLSAYDPAVVQNATFAVTVEPPRGSPTGQPSVAPVFVGKLIPVGP